MGILARRVTLAAMIVLAGSPGLRAGSLPEPHGPVLLTVEGDITHANRDGAADFDAAMLRNLGWETVRMETDWTDGPQLFEGAPLSALLEAVGARGEKLRAIALNDYAVDLPVSDATEFDVLLAMRRNGEAMPVRDKGPIWIIYPDTGSSADIATHNDKMVWQLRRIEVK